MITELIQDLINKITTVPALEGRAGAAVGGTDTDPTMAQAPLPYAWIVLADSTPTGDTAHGKKYRMERYNFSVLVGVAYGVSEPDLVEVQLPVLEGIAQAVSGTESFKYADLWEYQGLELKKIESDRLIYQLHFTIIGHHKTN